VLVGVFAGANVGQALVGDGETAGVTANAQDLSAGAHGAVGRVIENVALKGAGGLQGEAGGFKALVEVGQVVYAEFDLGLDGHGKERVYGKGQTNRAMDGPI